MWIVLRCGLYRGYRDIYSSGEKLRLWHSQELQYERACWKMRCSPQDMDLHSISPIATKEAEIPRKLVV